MTQEERDIKIDILLKEAEDMINHFKLVMRRKKILKIKDRING